MNIDPIVEKVIRTVERHKLDTGAYSRYLWQDEKNSRKMGINEYGCADAANLLYTVGRFPSDPDERRLWVKNMQDMQSPETGLFHEHTHHPIHTTAHVTAALELFDAQPKYPLSALKQYLDRDTLYAFLDSLDWENKPWPQSHQGAGLFAALIITKSAPLSWQDDYFAWLREKCDPETGISLAGRHGRDTLAHHLYGWFHYMFNHEFAKRPIPHPDRLIDSCIRLYDERALGDDFGRVCNFMEIDWVFCLNRATRQTPHRFYEAKSRLNDFAKGYIAYLDGVDEERDDSFNDLHCLFGAMCAVAELQSALPGELKSTYPLRLVLDRRPFI